LGELFCRFRGPLGELLTRGLVGLQVGDGVVRVVGGVAREDGLAEVDHAHEERHGDGRYGVNGLR
jgi:hypothetical protein